MSQTSEIEKFIALEFEAKQFATKCKLQPENFVTPGWLAPQMTSIG
jgi:hypothetical protein